MSFPYKNPISSIQLNGTQSVPRNNTYGTTFSVNNTGGYMEVFSLSDLYYTIPSGTTGSIEYSGNTIPIEFTKGTGAAWSPDVITLASDNISSGRRRLGMLAYVYEVDQVYQYHINDYETLFNAATASTGCAQVSDFGTTINNKTAAGQSFINSWTANTIEDVSGATYSTAVWRKFTTSPTFSGNTSIISGSKGSVITSGSSTTAFINVSGSGTVGGTDYVDFIRVTNTAAGATNPNKNFRVNNTGGFEIVNSAYGAIILTLTDAGVLSTPGGGTSDLRRKINVQYINDEITPHILNLKPVKFEYKDYSGTTRHGFVAQDVLITYPELVLGDGNKEDGTYGLDYDGILSLTVKSLQETILRVEKLEQEIKELKYKIG